MGLKMGGEGGGGNQVIPYVNSPGLKNSTEGVIFHHTQHIQLIGHC